MRGFLKAACATTALVSILATLPTAQAAAFGFEITATSREVTTAAGNGASVRDDTFAPTVFSMTAQIIPGTTTAQISTEYYLTRQLTGEITPLVGLYSNELRSVSGLSGGDSQLRAFQYVWDYNPNFYDNANIVFVTSASSSEDVGGGYLRYSGFYEGIDVDCYNCSYPGGSYDGIGLLDYDELDRILTDLTAPIEWYAVAWSYLVDATTGHVIAGTYDYVRYDGSARYLGAVPEPSTIALFGFGLLGLSFASRRLNHKA